MTVLLAALAALAWWILPVLLWRRVDALPRLEQVPDVPPTPAPRVSIILPARNEAAHIAACVTAIRASTWPNLELIVVDDHSTDGTGALARAAAAGDARVTVVEAPDLPAGWFGKQWACQAGASHATGALLLFTDADTRHAPDLVTRMVQLRAQRGAELFSVAGHQATGTVWERAVQPTVFMLIMARYGSAAALERARDPRDVVANGQCFLLSRTMYDHVGGHASVRAFVAEDVMMAQAVLRAGGRISLGLGIAQISTRMYDGLRSLLAGWGKNLYAGGRHAMRGGAVGQALYPFLLLLFPVGLLSPFVALALAGFGIGGNALGVWSVVATSGVLAAYAFANRMNGDSVWRALLAPLGGLLVLVICLRAVARGSRVEWKARRYTAE